MPGSLRRLLLALTALGLLTAVAAALYLLSLRAGRVEPATEVEFAAGPPPGVVVLEAAADPGTDPFVPSIAAGAADPALLPFPATDPTALASPDRRHSSADRAAAGDFGFALVRQRERGARLTVASIRAAAQATLGPGFTLADLEDGDGDGRDDDGRFTLQAEDGSAACLYPGVPRLRALALGLQADPADGTPASGYTWDPTGPCTPRPAPANGAGRSDGSTPGRYGGSAEGEVCDVSRLLAYLAADPAAARAWALVGGVAPEALAGYAAGLTPVILLQDTLVVDHGYDRGRILPRRAVLQRGTAVLVDSRGQPVARCLSGSPLLPARPLADSPVVLGAAWAGFSVSRVADLPAAERPVERFWLLDVATGQPLVRLPGSAGVATAPAGPAAAGSE